jgi:hypothetical protein
MIDLYTAGTAPWDRAPAHRPGAAFHTRAAPCKPGHPIGALQSVT